MQGCFPIRILQGDVMMLLFLLCLLTWKLDPFIFKRSVVLRSRSCEKVWKQDRQCMAVLCVIPVDLSLRLFLYSSV